MLVADQVAQALLEIHAVGFSLEKPITFKTGLLSPVYVDNRRLPFHPSHWALVFEGFTQTIALHDIQFDIISGVETAGIPHSATLAYLLKKPSVFVRKAAKDHGTKKMVEGGDIVGKKVLLIEDHVTTGSSSLKAVESLWQAGAEVTDCLSITSYNFPEATTAFAEAGVRLSTITSFAEIFEQAVKLKKITPQQVQVVREWLADPHLWAEQHTV